jgi:hypothetical protein
MTYQVSNQPMHPSSEVDIQQDDEVEFRTRPASWHSRMAYDIDKAVRMKKIWEDLNNGLLNKVIR